MKMTPTSAREKMVEPVSTEDNTHGTSITLNQGEIEKILTDVELVIQVENLKKLLSAMQAREIELKDAEDGVANFISVFIPLFPVQLRQGLIANLNAAFEKLKYPDSIVDAMTPYATLGHNNNAPTGSRVAFFDNNDLTGGSRGGDSITGLRGGGDAGKPKPQTGAGFCSVM